MNSKKIWEWMKQNFFPNPLSTFLTLLSAFIMGKISLLLFQWMVLNASWNTSAQGCHEKQGACWSFIQEKFRLIIFGLYPREEQWRPAFLMISFIALLIFSTSPKRWQKNTKYLAYLWLGFFLLAALLMSGGIFGISHVESHLWGGLPLTMILSFVGILCSYPIGILLALGRRSSMPLIKMMSVIYIELIRGVPLISLLFMSSVMLPLFLPEGTNLDKILRAQIALIMFASAYMAEVVRGGLQAVSQGQYEAASALGLNYAKAMRLVILPQALKVVIPPTVSTAIGIFKDTSLVIIISLFDLMYTMKMAQKDTDWLGFEIEAYFFVALIYFIFCFSFSRYSQNLEEYLHRGQKY